jgi:hypothetical protein
MTIKLTDLTLSAKVCVRAAVALLMLQSLISGFSKNNGVQGIFPAEMTSFITEFMNLCTKSEK